MKEWQVEQNSPEWMQLRCGLPTASCFDKICTATGAESQQAVGYMHHLLHELMLGKPIVEFSGNIYTERGHELEPSAAEFYEFTYGTKLREAGFVTDDAVTMGASPDRWADDGAVEIKSPTSGNYIKYLLSPTSLEKDFWVQTQGQMYVTKINWVDLMAYYPESPPVMVRVLRNEKFIGTLAARIFEFNKKLNEKKKKLIDMGYMPDFQRNDLGGLLYAG